LKIFGKKINMFTLITMAVMVVLTLAAATGG